MSGVGLPEKIEGDAFSSPENFKKNVLGGRNRVDYQRILSGERVAYFGECHDIACVKNELIKNLETFKAAGVTHLCLEHFSSGMQEEIGRYNAINGAGRDVLEKHLKQEKMLGSANALLDLVDAAKKTGIQIIAIGISEQYKKAIKFEYDGVEKVCSAKEKHMAEIITGLLKAKPNKLIVLAGAPFAQTNHLNAQVKKIVGVKGLCIRLVGCIKNLSFPEYMAVINEAVRKEGLARDAFSIDITAFTDAPKFDRLMHLPQIEEEKLGKKRRSIFSFFKKKMSLEEEFTEENEF